MTTTLLAIIQPIIALLLVLGYLKIKFDIKSWTLIWQAVLLGFASLVVMFLLDLLAGYFQIDLLGSLKRSAFYSFVVVGAGAELGKFLFLRYYFLKKKSFIGPLDGIIYALILSLSFTIIALPLFSNGVFASAVGPKFLYAYTIANVAFSIFLGFFVGMGKIRKNRLIDSLTGLGTASFFHGFFYFVNLTSDNTIYILYGVGLLLIALLLLAKAVNLKPEDYPTQP